MRTSPTRLALFLILSVLLRDRNPAEAHRLLARLRARLLKPSGASPVDRPRPPRSPETEGRRRMAF